MKKIRRIGIWGGPCCGKSTMAARLFSDLKSRGHNVEHVTEHVKNWAFLGRAPTGFDQVYLCAHQLHREEIILRNSSAVVVSESPLRIGLMYAIRSNMPGWKHLGALADEFEKVYPSVNFLITRAAGYNPEGRFETPEQAVEIDELIRRHAGVELIEVPLGDATLAERVIALLERPGLSA